ncbi:MAG: sugar ABC transporter permease [Lentisphaeria bacterium]|nr:sugar ABC transporter permease [Lentisphaeria bacterium]MBQ7396267.1 sugar ABC transporter permease [Lentisphaeria bacterium]
MATEISVKKLRFYWGIYALVLIPLALVLLFNYYPIFNGFIHIFYQWDGDAVEEFTGLENLKNVLTDIQVWKSFLVVSIFVVSNLFKMIIPITAAVVLHHVINNRANYVYRVMFVIPMVIPSMVGLLLWKYFYEPNQGILNGILRSLGVISDTDTILWLSDKMLTIPSLVFAGFPYVGAFGVLIYLAGLQNIPEEVYEAARVDGASPLRIFFSIELPLIMTQVRINLILMIIQTIQGWQNVYLYVGDTGGPDGVATVPGLLIFREAFRHGLFGYGCAIGFLIFLITLLLTFINNKFVRTEK